MTEAEQYYKNRYHIQMSLSPNNYFMYGYMQALGIKSVFEFGANAGRHLNQLEKLGMRVSGMDISDRAVNTARAIHGIDIMLGSGSDLDMIPSGSYECVFTNSVLCHIEGINEIIDNMKRISSRYVILVESTVKYDPENFWWVHDYEKMGFKSIYAFHVEKLNAVYQMYVWSSGN